MDTILRMYVSTMRHSFKCIPSEPGDTYVCTEYSIIRSKSHCLYMCMRQTRKYVCIFLNHVRRIGIPKSRVCVSSGM